MCGMTCPRCRAFVCDLCVIFHDHGKGVASKVVGYAIPDREHRDKQMRKALDLMARDLRVAATALPKAPGLPVPDTSGPPTKIAISARKSSDP